MKKAHKQETKWQSGKENNYRNPPLRQKVASPTPSLEDFSAEEAHMFLDKNSPNVPSVRVLQRRVISEEDPEDDGEAGDPDEDGPDKDEEEDIDQLVEEDEEEYG